MSLRAYLKNGNRHETRAKRLLISLRPFLKSLDQCFKPNSSSPTAPAGNDGACGLSPEVKCDTNDLKKTLIHL